MRASEIITESEYVVWYKRRRINVVVLSRDARKEGGFVWTCRVVGSDSILRFRSIENFVRNRTPRQPMRRGLILPFIERQVAKGHTDEQIANALRSQGAQRRDGSPITAGDVTDLVERHELRKSDFPGHYARPRRLAG